MALYDVKIEVEEVRGLCAAGYRKGDSFLLKGFYIEPEGGARICIHALVGMISLLSPFSHGVSAKELGIGEEDDIGYVQCPDPGRPYTCGGTVVFKLARVTEE
ncbi:MAG TPA: TIGR04076 family protein [Candidatus Korarchaeota archaeon]|nr:TIGR04076 family protein [Candidatus Korarchaeota archaeon]